VIAAPTMAELRAGRDAARHADVVELRLDVVDRPDVAGALQDRQRPVIVTCRAAWEGGHFKGSEEERQRILCQAVDAGAEYVDVEYRAIGVERWLRREDREQRVICSLHDFEAMPADLADRVRDMRRTGAAIVKVAAKARRLRDLLPLLAIGRAAREAGERTIVIGMGMAGVASRLLPAHFGSCWTYTASQAVAPGQVPPERLLQEFHLKTTTAATPVYAVVGRPIEHSISPAMHNAAFAAAGLDGVYIPCEAADFDDFLALADALPIVGASVTAPFKLDALKHARPVGTAAAGAACGALGVGEVVLSPADIERLGAVNTLRRIPAAADPDSGAGRTGAGLEVAAASAADRDARWDGTNTDVAGFIAPLRAAMSLEDARVAVLGAGGAARGVVAGLAAAGAVTTVYARKDAAAAELVAVAPDRTRGAAWPPAAGSWDVLVHTTPVGTFPHVEETPFQGPFSGRLVYDLIYNPRPTRLLREAADAGCATLDGLDMLVEQAARQFAWWTGVAPDIAVMREAALRRLAEMHAARGPS
jgi:3-dehydroquinate dehydratase/shikimate dehydrogenase